MTLTIQLAMCKCCVTVPKMIRSLYHSVRLFYFLESSIQSVKNYFSKAMNLTCRKMYNWWSKRLHRSNTKNPERHYTLWEEDFQLQDPGRLALFEEYLEMGIYD